MYAEEYATQVTFFMSDGNVESFSIPNTPQEFYQQLQLASDNKWFVVHLFDRSVVIHLKGVVKVEVIPAFSEIQGDGTISDAQEVTFMTRAARR